MVKDIRQTEIYKVEPISAEVEIAIEMLPGTDNIPAELIQEEGNTFCSEIHKFINCI
jgi:hypothetical protein